MADEEENISAGEAETANTNTILYPHQCTWELSVIIDDEVRTVGYPLTVDFNIVRNTSANANNAEFNIYNLAPATRSSEYFFQDRFNTAKKKIVIFKAGYEGKQIEIFKGYILESYSHRSGADIITQMQCLDLGNTTDYVNQTFEAGTTFKEVIEQIAQTSKEVTLSNFGDFNGEIKTPTTFSGDIMASINKMCGGHAFCDNGNISVLNNNEALDVGVTEINADTGLLNTPERRGGEVQIDSIFRPEIVVGQLLHITSSTASEFSGTYKVCGITHSGMISGAQGGERRTHFNLFIGANLPNSNYNVTGKTTKQGFSLVKGKNNIKKYTGAIDSDVQSVYDYIQKHNGQVPSGKICDGITWRNMIYPSGSENKPADVKREITVEYLQNCKTIANKLSKFVHSNWGNKTIKITSGWRTKENNASQKYAAKESTHLRGLAIDFTITQFNNGYTWKIFNLKWDKFAYRMLPSIGGNIHVQAVLGEGGAKRIRGQG